jgi:hypothetical protein
MTERHQRTMALERTSGPAAVLSGATILMGYAVAINLGGLEFLVAASDRDKLLDAASYILDGEKIIEAHVYEVALCKRAEMRTPTHPNGL